MTDPKNIHTEVTNTSTNEEHLLRQLSRTVAHVFVEMRKEKGYTSYESFAFDVDFPRAQYWRVENGRHNLTLRTLAKLLSIHGITVGQFLHLLVAEYDSMYPPSKTSKLQSNE